VRIHFSNRSPDCRGLCYSQGVGCDCRFNAVALSVAWLRRETSKKKALTNFATQKMIKLFSLQEKKREEEKTGKKRVQSAQLRVQKGEFTMIFFLTKKKANEFSYFYLYFYRQGFP
jgi:hypothetical protein